MTVTDRRGFLKSAGLGVAGTVALNFSTAPARALGANERVRLGVIGCGGRGQGVAAAFAELDECEVSHVCDPDSERARELAAKLNRRGGKPTPVVARDLRALLDERSVDAVLIATPDHWHAPAAIMACNAGKHVYVEKPCSHKLREGRLLIDAARRNNVAVQHGTQSRNMQLIQTGVQMLREGSIGDVLMAKAWNVQPRGNIGHDKPSDPPANVDYDTWVGPAPFLPFQKNRFHYGWHWFYNFGTGDMGNDGVHELDYARWGLGVETHPSLILALGGKLFHDDDQEFPDTQQVTFEYPGDGTPGSRRMLVFEMRLWSSNYPHNIDNGAEFYGTKGRMVLTKRGKLELFDAKNQKSEQRGDRADDPLRTHQLDFFAAIKSGSRPAADIEIGHLSASLCHLGNIATRLGRTLEFDPAAEQVQGDEEAARLVRGEYRDGHWGVPQDV
jgi:predicted dehydrogenase